MPRKKSKQTRKSKKSTTMKIPAGLVGSIIGLVAIKFIIIAGLVGIIGYQIIKYQKLTPTIMFLAFLTIVLNVL